MDKEILLESGPLKIAVVRLSAMGDCILLQPILLQILDHYPNATIDWFIDPAWISLFSKTKRLNLIPTPKPKKLKDYMSLKRSHFTQSYDLLLAVQASFRANLLYGLIKAPIKLGFDRQRARDGQWLFTNRKVAPGNEHLLDGFRRFADALKVPNRQPAWLLAGAQKQDLPSVIGSALGQRPVIGIVPAASKQERTPQVTFWHELLSAFASKNWPVNPLILLLGGPTELECDLARQMIKNKGQLDVLNLVGETSLYLLSGLLREVNVLISPDSGPAHLANAHQTPVIGLYAVAPAMLSGPYNFMSLTIDVYPRALEQFLNKNESQVKWGTRVHDRRAMGLINPLDVVEKLFEVIKP